MNNVDAFFGNMISSFHLWLNLLFFTNECLFSFLRISVFILRLAFRLILLISISGSQASPRIVLAWSARLPSLVSNSPMLSPIQRPLPALLASFSHLFLFRVWSQRDDQLRPDQVLQACQRGTFSILGSSSADAAFFCIIIWHFTHCWSSGCEAAQLPSPGGPVLA